MRPNSVLLAPLALYASGALAFYPYTPPWLKELEEHNSGEAKRSADSGLTFDIKRRASRRVSLPRDLYLRAYTLYADHDSRLRHPRKKKLPGKQPFCHTSTANQHSRIPALTLVSQKETTSSPSYRPSTPMRPTPPASPRTVPTTRTLCRRRLALRRPSFTCYSTRGPAPAGSWAPTASPKRAPCTTPSDLRTRTL